MAEGNQPQKRNLAEAAFRKNYAALYDALAQPLVITGLAVKLYSAVIITSETRDAILTSGIPPARQASLLLQAVEASIKSDYTRLRKFTRVLRKQPVLEPIAKKLRQRYCALVSKARLTESSSSGSDSDITEQDQSQATVPVPAATNVYPGPTGQQGSVSLDDYTKRNLQMIQRKFIKLQQNACEALQLKLNEKEVKKLHLFLTTILPHGFAECLPKSSDLMEIFEAMTHNDLWNHSNYFPLESLIEEFGGDTELTTQVEQFKMDRSSFQIATKIKDYIPAAKSLLVESDEPVESAPTKRDRKYLWKLGVKLDECVADESLTYLDLLWRSLANTLRLPPVSLVLHAIVEKSILVVWLISAKLGPKAIEIARQSAEFFRSYPILSVTIGDECVYEKEIKGEKKLSQSSSFAHEMQVPRSPSVDKSEELPPMPPAHLPSTTTELNLQAMPSENEAKSAPPILPYVSKPGQHPGTSPKDTEINISGNGIPGGPSSQPPQTPPNKMQHETLPTGAQTQPTSKWTRVKEGALPRLLNLLSPVVHSWGLFALQIGVPNVQISQIHAANPPTNPNSLYTSLTQALEWWINNHDNPTYEVIISVLDPKLGETTPVMNRALASQVRGFMAKEQAPVSLPAATSACIGPTGQQGAVSLDDFTKRNLIMIKKKFTKLQQNACKVLQEKLSEKEIMENLHQSLTALIPREIVECLPNSSDLMKIFQAMTRNDLWNYSNYFPLESLIEEFGDDTELTTQLEQFKKDRSSFQIATKIKDYIPAAKSLLAELDEPVESTAIKQDLLELRVKLDECFADETLDYLEQLWRSLANTLVLPPVSVVLRTIMRQSILVVWLIPAKLGPKAIEIARQSAEFFRSYPILSVTIGDECVYEKELKGEKKLLQSSFVREMQVPQSPSVDINKEDDISGNGIPEEPSSQPPQTSSNTVKFETPPVSPTGAQTQPTSKSKAKEPFAATAEIEFSDLEFEKKVGEGGTGTVYKGHWKSRGLDVAIKTAREINKTEVEHLSSLDHPNIVSFYGGVTKMPDYYIVTEFAEHGSLHDYLQMVKFQVDYEQRLKWAMQIAKGMNYLHNMKIMHRDLKPHNVLVTKDLTAKICDFSAAKTFEHTTAHTMTGTFRWIAPEVLKEEPYSLKCDVFSFGMILYELIACKEPFSDSPAVEAVSKIRNGEKPAIPDSCEPFLSNLLTMCWKEDPKARPTFAEIVSILENKATAHEIEISDLEFERKVGEGGTGTVYKGHWKSRGLDVAIKTTGAFNKTEVEHLSSLDHPNIILPYGVVMKMPKYYIVTEFAEHGSLHDYLHETKFQVDYKQRLKWAKQVAEGMNYLHMMKIMHRDLKPHNVLVSKDLTAKICDFSAAKRFEHTTAHTMTGTFRWIAPEVLNEEPYSLQCDVFSFGMILYELIACKEPFSDIPAIEVVSKIRNGEKPDIPSTSEAYLSSLLTRCWETDPKARPTFAEIVCTLDSKGFYGLSKIFLQSLKIMVDSMDETIHTAEKAKSALSSLTLQLRSKEVVPLVDSAAYQEARTIPELMKSMSPYWNCLSTGILNCVIDSSECSASASALHDFKSARDSSSYLILVAQASTASSGDQKALHPLQHHSEKLQSYQPAVFTRLAGHQLCASVNVTQISVTVDKAVLHLTDYDHVTEAVVAFLQLPVAALVYCGCSENPLSLFWEVSRELVGHISSVVPASFQQYRQLLENNITTLCVSDELKYSCPNMKHIEYWAASSAGHADKILDLLKCVTVDVVDFAGLTALVYASLNGHSQAVKALIAEGANVNHQIKDGHTPLSFASTNGHTDVAELLLNNGAKVNLQAETGATPLYMASQEGHSETVQLLLSRGANINLQAKTGATPLFIAAQNGHTKTGELLINGGGDVNLQRNDGTTPLYMASQNGHSETVQLLLSRGANINLQKKNGFTPLSVASQNGHSETVQLLLSRGANVNLQSKTGATPLYMASQEGHSETVQLLLSRGANVNLQKKTGATPLYIASEKGHSETVQLLLSRGANINLQEETGATPLFIAAQNGHTKTGELLINGGGDVNLQRNNGFTPLSVASHNGHSETVQLLLSRGANVNLQEKAGATPLFIAAQNGHTKTGELLINGGGDVNLQGNDGVTPLFIASQNGHSETVQLLLSRGANINLPRKDGNTPLILASWNGHPEIVELLIRSDADINALGRNQETAVMWAARKGHIGVVTRLLQHRANIKITNKKRETALDIATRAGHTKICEELRKYC